MNQIALRPFRAAVNPSIVQAQASSTGPRAHVIVFGNEKGGSGKSTAAMHVAVALLREGKSVGTIDVDARQGTFTRYFENRRSYNATRAPDMPMPRHHAALPSTLGTQVEPEADEPARPEAAPTTCCRPAISSSSTRRAATRSCRATPIPSPTRW